MRGQAPSPGGGDLRERCTSSGTLHIPYGSPDHEALEDTAPDNSTEDPGSPILRNVAGVALAGHPAPLDKSQITRYPIYRPTSNTGFDLVNTTGFADTNSPLFSHPEILDDMGDLNFNFND